jgi:hypothetical protein
MFAIRKKQWAKKEGGILYLNKESQRKVFAAPHEHVLPENKPAGPVTALRIDFIAKPGDAAHVASAMEELLDHAGLHHEGLQASMLLVSDREARLVTLLTLWDAERFNAGRERLTAWTLKIVAALADGPVRGYTSFAHFLVPQAFTKLTLSDLRPAEIAELVEIMAVG